ncbi:MAG: hypothetical protein ACRC67_33255 [Inquilinus sp.]|uniref:hypothetical protein n=1 Tax=Inquilinus sp. TaxID=1932117 RepID=UPI003F35A329
MRQFLGFCAACGAGTAFGYAGASLSCGETWRAVVCLVLGAGLTAIAARCDRPSRLAPTDRRPVRLRHGV